MESVEDDVVVDFVGLFDESMLQEDMNLFQSFGEAATFGSGLRNVQSGLIEIDGKVFIKIGPFLPLKGCAFSNFINRDFFQLSAKRYDLMEEQTRSRKQTQEFSFVERERDEFVLVRVKSEVEVQKFRNFLTERRDDVLFVLSHSEINGPLTSREFLDARAVVKASLDSHSL